MAGDQEGQLVDLSVVRAACAPLLGWYDRFLDQGRGDIHELDEALCAVRKLGPVGGRVGRAIALLAGEPARQSTKQVVAALELLRQTPALRTHIPPVATGPLWASFAPDNDEAGHAGTTRRVIESTPGWGDRDRTTTQWTSGSAPYSASRVRLAEAGPASNARPVTDTASS